MSLANKRILVTGGTGKLGRALVKRLLDDGAWVAVTYRDNTSLAALLSTLPPDGPQPKAFQCELSDADSVAGLAEELEQNVALPLHGMALLAGGWEGGGALWEAPEGQLDDLLRDNVLSTWNALHRFAGGMAEAGYGRIVTIGARHADRAVKGNAAYAAAKAAIAAMTTTLAEDLRGTGVTATCLLPWKMSMEPSAKSMTYDDAVPLLAWLLDDDAAVVDGDTLRIDGPR